MRTPALTVATAGLTVLATLAAAPAPAVTDARVDTRGWTALSSSEVPNYATAATVRGADGLIHVVTRVTDGAGGNYEHTTISATGAQGPVTKVMPAAWQQLETEIDLGIDADGTLRMVFRGSQSGVTSDFFSLKGIYTAFSTDGGATWSVPRAMFSRHDAIGGGSTLAYLPDGTPIAGHGDSGGFHWRIGTTDDPTAVNAEFTDTDAASPSLVSYGGAVHVVYQSWNQDGVFARQIWPTLGAQVRGPGENTNPGQAMAVVARPGVGPVVAYKVDNEVVLWDVLANETHRVPGMTGPNHVELAIEPDGHMWVAAVGPIGYEPRVSRVAKVGWKVDKPTLLPELGTHVAVGSVSPTRAEILITAQLESGQPYRIHARSVAAKMKVKASPRRWRVGQSKRVTFTATDVDGRLRGVRIKAGGKQCTTNRRGVCRIRFSASRRPTQIRAKATRSGYDKVVTTLKISR